MPQILWTGVSIAYYSGILVDEISASVPRLEGQSTADYESDTSFKAAMAMIGFGVGEILGCFFIGFIVDKFGSRKAAWVNVTICFLMTAVTLIFLLINNYNASAYAMCFLWGVEDSATNTHL